MSFCPICLQLEAKQAVELIDAWEPIDLDDSLELLSAIHAHPSVRGYAVSQLQRADNEELLLYLLQLVQALKYEPATKDTEYVVDVDTGMCRRAGRSCVGCCPWPQAYL